MMAPNQDSVQDGLLKIQLGFDLATVIIAIAYIALRRSYSFLIDGPLLLTQTQDQLAEANIKLADLNANLESLVAERTAALLETTQKLEAEVAERHHIAEELQEKTTILQLVLNTISDGVIVANKQGDFLFLNPAAEQMFSKEMIQADPPQWLPTSGLFLSDQRTPYPRESLPLIKAIQGQASDNVEMYVRPAGVSQGIWALVNGRPLRDAEGELQGGVVVCRDVSDRKQSEAQLREREQFLQTIYDGAETLIFVADISEDQDFYVVGWNAAAERATGFSSEFVQGRRLEELLGESQGAEVRQRYQACLAAEKPVTYEECISFDDQERWWLTTYNPVRDSQGKIYRIVGSTIDISDRKQAEAQLHEKANQLEKTLQELQHTQAQLVQTEKMSSLGQLVAGVAHEINNPVNFISGNLTHAAEYAQDLLKLLDLYQSHYVHPHPEIQEVIEEIDLEFLSQDLPKLLGSMRVGAERIQKIVASLRTFSRMDEAEFKTVDIHDGIDSTLMILQNRLKAKSDRPGIEVIKNYGNLPLIDCFAGQLNQVFMNILVNALDALDERDQTLTLDELQQHPSQIHLTTELFQSDWIRIRIQDNGPGMSEVVRQRIFNPFFTTKAVGKGTGMGMSISYQIVVERHQGQLHCFSQSGQGTEFVIEIPISQKLS